MYCSVIMWALQIYCANQPLVNYENLLVGKNITCGTTRLVCEKYEMKTGLNISACISNVHEFEITNGEFETSIKSL